MVRHQGDINIGPTPIKHTRSMAVSPLVGRDDELCHLTEALDLAAEDQGGVIFLTGEPGIGKTRLARETLDLAKERGFTVLEGRAYPLEAGLAYAPLVDAFRPLLRNADHTRLQSLVSDLPSLGHLFEGLSLPPAVFPLEGLGNPALEKTRLFEAVSRFLERLTQETPVALFIDDLHWADPATLELLHYLARGLSDQAALLLASYRTDSLDSSRRLRELVEPLQRVGLAEEMVLHRLKPDATAKLIRGILGEDAPNGLLSLVDARAGGTPLFIEALIYALIRSGNLDRGPSDKGAWVLDVDGAMSLPHTVRRLILERLDRLAPPERRVLDLLAVMGDATSHAILRAASDMEEEAFIGTLRRLRAAALFADGIDGSEVTYSITHPLIQEVAYAELPEIERRRAHQVATRALESFSEGQPNALNRLARHYRAAGSEAEPERALAALVAAGERALLLYANEEAAQHFGAALSLLRKGGGCRTEGGEGIPSTLHPQPSTFPTLLERLGEAWERIGKPEAAVDLWNEALVERERAGDAVGAARLHHRLALAEFYRYHLDKANAHVGAGLVLLTEGLDLQKKNEPCQELADLHFARYHILIRMGDTAGVGETTKELLSIAERLASPRAEAQANVAASSFSLRQNDIAKAREYGLHALMIAESFPERQELANCCRAHIGLIWTGMYLGEHHFMRHHAEQGLAAAKRLGAPHMEILLYLCLGYANFMSGAWEESQRWSTEAVLLARRQGQPRDLAHALAGRALILAMQGDLADAEACVSEVRTAFDSPSNEGSADSYIFGLVDMAETALALEQGRPGRALDIARSFINPPGPRLPGRGAGLEPADRPVGLMLLAEAQVAAGEPEGALETARKIVNIGPTGTPYFSALAAWADGLARQALHQREAALDCFGRAYEGFIALEMPVAAARCLLKQAEVGGHKIGDGGLTPAQAAQQSLAIFERAGASIFSERARRFLRGLGLSPVAKGRARLGGVPLSERELEVALLVAEGLTTAEIADRLSLSGHTVNAHLGHIYSRLGIGSRAALTRYVIEVGLLSPAHESYGRNR